MDGREAHTVPCALVRIWWMTHKQSQPGEQKRINSNNNKIDWLSQIREHWNNHQIITFKKEARDHYWGNLTQSYRKDARSYQAQRIPEAVELKASSVYPTFETGSQKAPGWRTQHNNMTKISHLCFPLEEFWEGWTSLNQLLPLASGKPWPN